MWVVGRLDDKLGMFRKDDDKRISSYIDPSAHTIWVHTQNIVINKRAQMSTNMSVVHIESENCLNLQACCQLR
jgi:hypothetical protein